MVLNLKRKNKGFSLLELIIAIAILSIGITAILEALSFSSRAGGLSCDIIKAVFLAQDKIQALEFEEKQNLAPVSQSDSGQRDKFDWKYAIDSEPVLTSEKITVSKLNFEITWQKAAKAKTMIFNTYLKHEE